MKMRWLRYRQHGDLPRHSGHLRWSSEEKEEVFAYVQWSGAGKRRQVVQKGFPTKNEAADALRMTIGDYEDGDSV
jgi:hypothetical protein